MNSKKTAESHSNPFREWIHTSKLSPFDCKPLPSDCPSPENPFRAGMKLEAVDFYYPNLYCVASILRVTGDELLICFDGWSDVSNYWCRFNSPEIRPIHTCQKNGIHLRCPGYGDGARDLWRSSNGDWEEYLLNTGSSALLEEEFSPLFLPESDSRVFTLTEFSARVLLFYQMDISKLPTQLQERIQNPKTCSKCETKFLIGWKSVRMFTKLSRIYMNNVDRTGIFCSQKCAAIFSVDLPLDFPEM